MLKRHKTLRIARSSKGKELLFAWLTLVIIPLISFIWLFEYLLVIGEKHIVESAKVEMMAEMDAFRENLNTDTFLEFQQNQIAREFGFSGHTLAEKPLEFYQNLTAESIREFFEKKLGISVFATFYHGPDTKKVSFSLAREYKNEFMISKTMLKNLFLSINGQHLKSPLLSHGKTSKLSKKEIETLANRGEAFIKALFQTAGEFRFETGEVKTALSGKLDLGKLYFFYSSKEVKNEKTKANAGGFITILRQRDVPVQKVMKFSAKRASDPIFKRSFAKISFASVKQFSTFPLPISRIVDREKDISFLSPFPSHLINRITCQDTYYPLKMHEVLANYPLLKISVEKAKLKHPLRKYFHPVKTFCLITGLLISIIFLRLFFFGFAMPLKIRSKIMSAVIAASILPFSALWMIAGYHENFRREFRQVEIIQYLNQSMEEFSISVGSFRTSLENQNAELENKLSFLETYEMIPFLTRWMKRMPITHIATRINRNDGVIALDKKEKMSEFETEFKDLVFTAIENSFRKKKEDGSENNGEIGLVRFKIRGIGPFLANIGLIHNSNFSNTDALYCIIPVFPVHDRSLSVTTAFLLKFSTRLVLNDFFKTAPQFIAEEQKAGFRIKKCFIPLANSAELPPREDFICAEDFPIEKTIDKGRKILVNKSEGTWTTMHDGKLQIVHADFSPSLQCIVLMVADQISDDQFSILPSPLALSAYLLGLIIVVVLIMGRFFVDPVKLLQDSAEEVAAGNFSHRLELASGDEFSQLATVFNGMIKGLNEREKLSSFVSESVLSEVSENQQSLLLPGGERTEVSVVFCSLPDLKKLSPKKDSAKILSYLGVLIDTADAISRKHCGVIDKIIEDTVMIVFRQSDAGNTHVLSACKAALEIAVSFPSDECPMKTSSGIASGSAVSGKIGSREGKLDYTVIGNPVNLAARLKSQSWMADQTGILLCPQTIRMLKGLGKLRFIERIEIKGRTRTFPMYELLALRAKET